MQTNLFVSNRKSDLLVRCQVVYDVGVACDAGGEKGRHAVAVLLHGSSILKQHPHDLQTARLCTVMKRCVACEQTTYKNNNKSYRQGGKCIFNIIYFKPK